MLHASQYRLLLIEDNEVDSDLFREMIAETTFAGSEVVAVTTLRDGIELLSRESFDIVMLDLSLPDSSGIEGLLLLREKFTNMPIVIFTGLSDNEAALDAIKAGAQDYVEKGRMESYALENSIRYAIERHRLMLDKNMASLALKKSEENFKRLVETMNEGVLMISPDQRIQYANNSFCEMIGYSEEELKGRPAPDLFVTEGVDTRFIDSMMKLRKRGVSTSYRLQMKRNGEGLIWVEISGAPILDDGGEVIGMLGVYSNVTERKKMEDELQESNDRFMSIFNQATVGIAQIAINGRFLHVNEQMSVIFGYSRNEFTDMTFFDITHPDEHEITSRVYEKFVQGQRKDSNLVKRYIHKSGHVIHINVYAKLVKGKNGVPYFVTIYNDISKRIEAENNVVKALSEGQEKERKRIAQELHDGLGQSLSGIKMYLQLVEPGEEGTSKLDTARKLVDDAIREYRAVSHNLLPPALEESSLTEALADLCEKVKKASPLRVSFLHEGHCENLGRNIKTELYRITQEVINNTLKHSKASRLLVKVSRRNGIVVLQIEDDGIGFDTAAVSRTGIGLKNLYARTKSLNGKVTIRSAPSEGTTVHIEVPHQIQTP